jgi:hypothetical protein
MGVIGLAREIRRVSQLAYKQAMDGMLNSWLPKQLRYEKKQRRNQAV